MLTGLHRIAPAFLAVALALPVLGAGEILFNRDIRPILSDKCFSCHGPDANKRKAELRLDLSEDALRNRDGLAAIVPGYPDRSELIRRIEAVKADDRMPPTDSNRTLLDREKALLRQWIESGAAYQPHWSFLTPTKVDSSGSASEAIDHFVRRALVEQGLEPAPAEGRERLLRRVTMDLTGLPPTVREMDAFLEEDAPEAYEREVDRLLGTTAHAERLALDWMDLARYADSHGMHADGFRYMWPWRDWVIRAFHRNMPYNEFVTWQMAGDLLPDATREQILATAFHRNHPMTAEGGVIDEEFRLQYVFDRTETTATAFLGMTVQCARCHDHKFDPVSQADYFRLTAFFNNVKELGMTGDDDNYGPMLLLPDQDQEQRIREFDARIAQLEAELATLRADLSQRLDVETIRRQATPLAVPPAKAHFPLDDIALVKKEDGKQEKLVDGNALARPDGNPEAVAGRLGQAIRFDDEYDYLSISEVGLFEMTDHFSIGAWVQPEERGKIRTVLGTSGTKNDFWRGWEFFLDEADRPAVKLVNSLPHNYLHAHANISVPTNGWSHVMFTYDGSGRAEGVRFFVNGRAAEATTVYDRLYKSIHPVNNDAERTPLNRPIRVAKSYRAFTGEFGIFKGLIDDIRLFAERLTSPEVAALYQQMTGTEPAVDDAGWADHHLARQNRPFQNTAGWLREVRIRRLEVVNPVPEVMVMEEMPSPRTAHLLKRGQYDLPQQAVEPGTPAKILPFPDSLPGNRLGLARWLFLPDNPLTTRVTVNRYWQMLFGRGLVETTEDFGNQGARPTHPELLDWLAADFAQSGWDVRRLLKHMVMSETYRRSSKATPESREKDPANRWLARAPTYRLPAEMIRDHALAASGLLDPTIGGPSAKPYQPEGLWIEKGNFSAKLLDYKTDTGSKLYRRSLYTFIRRTSPPPMMTTFDAPPRDVCTVRRDRTSTPLQALVLMNDPQFVEAARVMAERVQREAGGRVEDQLRFAFRSLTGRQPAGGELSILTRHFEEELERFDRNPEVVRQLFTTGERARDPLLEPVRTAALAVVMNTLMNYDEFAMKR